MIPLPKLTESDLDAHRHFFNDFEDRAAMRRELDDAAAAHWAAHPPPPLPDVEASNELPPMASGLFADCPLACLAIRCAIGLAVIVLIFAW